MATHVMSTAALVRSVLGYKPFGQARVPGVAVTGDKCIIINGPHDLSGGDYLIQHEPGIEIKGSGQNERSRIKATAFAQGTGGPLNPTVYRDWLLDSTGLNPVSDEGLGGGEASVNGIQDSSFVHDNFGVIDDSPSGARNLFTVWSETGDPILYAIHRSLYKGASSDCFSTKGGAAIPSMGLRLTGCRFEEWGSANNNNGYTGHDDWLMYGWSAYLHRAVASGLALAHASNVGAAYDANVQIEGGGVAAFDLVNSHIDLGGASGSSGVVRGRWENCHLLNAASRLLGTVNSGTALTDCAFTQFGATDPALDFNSLTGVTDFAGLVIDGYRGVDMRGCSGTVNLDRSILNTTNHEALRETSDGPMNTTNNQVSTAGFNVPFTGAGDVIGAIAQATVDAAVADIDAAFGLAPEPNPRVVMALIESGNGHRLLDLGTPAAIVAACQGPIIPRNLQLAIGA